MYMLFLILDLYCYL